MSRPPRDHWFRERWMLVVILVAYVAIGLAYSAIVPAFEAPDEPAHLRYVRYLVTQRRFPVQQSDPAQSPTLEAHQPPAYYVLSAILTSWIAQADFGFSPPNPCVQWSPDLPGQRYVYLHGPDERFPYHGGWLALHIVRAFSVALGAVTVWVTYRLGRAAWPEHRLLGPIAAAVLALNPQFLFIHASANNDTLAVTVAALILLCSVRALQTPPRWREAALLGLLLGLGALTKYSVLALAPVAIAGALLPPLRQRRWRRAALHLGLLLLVLALISGWWYVRNVRVYGDPWAWQVALASHPHDVRTTPLTWADLRLCAGRVFASYWGYFGWMNVRLSPVYYGLLALVTAAGVVGSIAGLVRAGHREREVLSLLLLAVASVLVSFGRYVLTYNHTAYQGRLLMGAAPAIAVLLAYGWATLLGVRCKRLLVGAVLGGGAILNLVGLGAILGAYPPAETYHTAALSELSQPCIVLDDRFQLVAYDVRSQVAREGEALTLDLYWYGLVDDLEDREVEVRLWGREDALLAQAGLRPQLERDRISGDRVSLQVGPSIQAAVGRLEVRVLDGMGEAQPIVSRNRHPLGEAFALQQIKVVPAEPLEVTYQEAVGAQFGGEVLLLGYDLSAVRVAPGEALEVVLYWQAMDVPAADYTVYVHLMDEQGHPVAQGDGPPDAGSFPTSWWGPGERVRDVHRVPVGVDVGARRYRLGVGLYRPDTSERLDALDAEGEPLASGTVVLSDVIVTAPR